MSEYQYYEFLALERPLTVEEQRYMRALSSRGHITPVSFSNEYNWADFKGDPVALMKRFYDAHVYVANWCTAIFMLRAPLATLNRKQMEAFTVGDTFEAEATPTHWILTWRLDESEDYDRFTQEDGSRWMARLSPLREELLRGDLRPLYIGWLAAVSMGLVEDDELEPYLPEGLAPFSPAQQALAEFLEIDADLLTGAGIGRPFARNQATEIEIDDWIASAPVKELQGWVKLLLTGQAQKAEREVKRRFAARLNGADNTGADESTRTVGELWGFVEQAGEIRQLQEKQRQEQEKARRQKERDAYLKRLAGTFPKAWLDVHEKAKVGLGKAYDDACQAIADLKEAYNRHASQQEFDAELQTFLEKHRQRKSLVQRLVKTGLMKV